MGIEVLFIVICIIWLAIFFYLLFLHIEETKVANAASRLYEQLETLKRRRGES